jgi:hypothetical protein
MTMKLPCVYYQSADGIKLLSEWAYFFIRLGYQLSTIPCKNHRFVVGVAVPAREFASCLAATGVVFARAGIKNRDSQVEFVLNLAVGTPVYIRDENNRKLRGVLEGFTEHFGKSYIVIKTADSQKNSYPLSSHASRITVSETDVSLPAKQQKGYKLETPSEFLKCCFGENIAGEHVLDSSFEALLIGKVSSIKREICSQAVICKGPGKVSSAQGFLQDILRVRQFSGANQAYRTQCLSSSRAELKSEVINLEPAIVVFDGAIAYLRHSYGWRVSHHIVVLDRTERQFVDALELLNQNYTYRSDDDFNFSIKVPHSVEMMIFKEQIDGSFFA